MIAVLYTNILSVTPLLMSSNDGTFPAVHVYETTKQKIMSNDEILQQ